MSFFLIAAVLLAATLIRAFFNGNLRIQWLQLKYNVIFNLIGFYGLTDDFVYRQKNRKFDPPDATGCVALITGGSRGIGAHVVKGLLRCNAHVIIGCRNVSVADNLVKKIREEGIHSGSMEAHKLDTSSLSSVRSFAAVIAEKHQKLNLLINNAGILYAPYIETEDGFELQFATNYLGHFYLTHLLMPLLKAGASDKRHSRIVNISSAAHLAGNINFLDINNKKCYVWPLAYCQSKLAQILFTRYLDKTLESEGSKVRVYAVHPGIVNTEIFNETHVKIYNGWAMKLFFKSPTQGAKSILYACLSSELDKGGGSYISNCKITSLKKLAYSTNLQKTFFDFSNNLLNIKEFGHM